MGRSDISQHTAFDPDLDLSPYTLFRWLGDRRPLLLVDTRQAAGKVSFDGARCWQDPHLRLTTSQPTVLFDDDGRASRQLAREQRRCGLNRVFALYGGLALYDHALDPLVVGDERFLVSIDLNPDHEPEPDRSDAR